MPRSLSACAIALVVVIPDASSSARIGSRSLALFTAADRLRGAKTVLPYRPSSTAQAVVVTAAAQGQASTTGASAGASAGNNNASTAGNYYKGMATFIVTKGGLIAGVSIGGQKFDYKRL
jgi:hypothetical protein